MLGDTMNEIIEAILSMIVGFSFIGICVWLAHSIEQWGETK
tara:strand:+ start:1551 stop:1673 length:123 start_codon:yes stop_codon:yes gene_type:complete